MKEKLRKNIVWVFFVVLAVVGSIFAITAQDNAGKIEISKTATKMITNDPDNNLVYGRKAKVELNVKAHPYNKNITTYDKLDVVLVLDSSGSMKEDNKLVDLKAAAKDLVKTLMSDGTNQVGIVEFGTNVKRTHELTTNKNNINRFIERMSADGGTNVQQAVASANSILKEGKRSDAQQIVIILTDGIPTYFNYNGSRYGTGNSDASVCVESGWMGCTKKMKPSEAAKTELDKLKGDNNTSDVYTIVFGNDEDAKDILATINPEQDKPLYKNYNALSGEQLKKMFQTIIEESVGRIGNDTVVTDIIPKEFKLTNASKTRLTQQGVEIIDNVDGTTTLKWNIGNIDADIDYKLSYEVRANEDYHGSMYTNENAILTTTVSENNPYYDKTNLTLEFDKPAVEIPAITKNDHYSHNSSYVGYSESVINGTTILKNDLNKNKLEDIHVGNNNTKVTDEIIIVTDENTKKNADGSYSIYKDGTLMGTLNMNEDGTFSFISEEGITGEVSFDYVIKSSISQNHETSFVISNTSKVTLNILERQKIDITGTKTWNDNDNQDGLRTTSVVVNLYENGKFKESKVVTKDENWTYTFNNLYKYEKGHENDPKYEIKYEITENPVSGYVTEINGYNVTNTHNVIKTEVSGQKTWKDNNNQDGKRPDSITVKLYADGEYVTEKEVTKDENWSYSFTDLDKYKDGKEITYTVEEEQVEDYTASVEGYNITNTHEIEKIEVSGTKTWDDEDNKDGLRPSFIRVNLLEDGVKIDSKVVNENTNWSYTFSNLDKYKDGKEIVYTVEEILDSNTSKYYEKEINGYDITNTHVVKTVKVNGIKTWDDEGDRYGRVDKVTINLLADGVKIDSKEVTENDNWTYTFDNLPMYKDGKKITYTVSEDKVKDYDTSYDGYNVTNTYNPEKTQVSGKKTWDDKDDQDGLRPSSITVVLYDHLNNEIDRKTVTDKDNWTYTFDNLPKYANGEEIKYTVKEASVDGYETEINGNNITNKHIPEVISKTVTKVWNDDNNRDGIRSKSIKVILKADGEKVKEATLNETNNWTYTFDNLAKYKNKGTVIKYTVEEIRVDGYDVSIKEKDNGFIITNTHEIDTNNLVIKKVWKDNNDQDGKRPGSLDVKVIGKVDGEVVVERNITLNENNNFRYEFADLPMNYNGKKITYTARENMNSDTAKYYTEEDPVYEDGIITLTNVHEIEKTQVVCKKVWVDAHDKDGLRPGEITINLYADGVKLDSKVISSSDKGDNSDEWIYSFTDLDKYKDGKEITYTVSEEVDGKTKEHYLEARDENNDFIIINTHNPKDVTVSGTKTWKDDDNKYGRPDEITVNLKGMIGDETVVEKSTKVSEDTNWTYSFEGLPEYSKGKLINYTISENAVRDYNTEYDGYNIINTYNPETIKISGVKTWDDENNQDGIRPDSITVVLYDHLGNEIETVTANEANNWTYTFDNLPKYANGEEIKYTVKEVSVDGYETEINDFDITNRHTPEVISYKVTKVWNDNNNQDGIRPDSITVNLYADGVKVDFKVLNASNNWTYVFKNLPKYKDGGIAIKYSLVEDEVKGYTTNIPDPEETTKETKELSATITNTHEVEKRDLKVTKTWLDKNNKSNKRPDFINVNVFANGNLFTQITLTKDNNWMFILSNLDKYKDGKEILYTLEELKVNGYITSYDGYNIINTLKEDEKKVPVSKTNIEILPPKTGIDNKNDSNLIEILLMLVLSASSVILPVRVLKNN